MGKDLLTEWRTREILTSTLGFAIVVLVVFNFAFEPGGRDLDRVGAGMLWATFLFAGILGMTRLYLNEQEEGGLEGMMLCPVERTTLYLAKAAALFLFLIVTEAVTLALFAVLFAVPLAAKLPALAVVVGLGTVGLTAVGTSFAAMAVRTRTREVLLPMLLVPVTVPVLIAAVRCTAAVLGGGGLAEVRGWIQLLAAFDALYLALGYLTFPAILEE